MPNWIRRLRKTAAASLVVPLLFIVISVAVPGIADARCDGKDKSVTSTLILDGAVVVSETPATRTCNLNQFYDATFRSHVLGWRASVWIRDYIRWSGHGGSYSSLGDFSYSYTDINSNSNSIMVLCLDDRSVGYCGWGSNVDLVIWPPTDEVLHSVPFGVNSGY